MYLVIFFRYFAICQPIEYQRSKKTLNPRVEVALAFILGFIIQTPQFVANHVVNTSCKIPLIPLNTSNSDSILVLEDYSGCYCLTKSGYHYFVELGIIDFRDGTALCPHLYQVVQLTGLDKRIWMAYKICCEILVRLGHIGHIWMDDSQFAAVIL